MSEKYLNEKIPTTPARECLADAVQVSEPTTLDERVRMLSSSLVLRGCSQACHSVADP